MLDLVAIAEWEPAEMVLSFLAGLAGSEIAKKSKSWRIKRKFWRDHFPEFYDSPAQTIIGTSKRVDLSIPQLKIVDQEIKNGIRIWGSYDYIAAKKYLIPSIKQNIKEYFGISVQERTLNNLALNKTGNIFLYGGWASNELSTNILYNNKNLNFGFGIKDINGEIQSEISRSELQALRNQPGESEWVIVDKSKNNMLLCDPLRKSDGTYKEEGILILRTKNPYNANRDILFFMGCHILGTYLGDTLFREKNFIECIDDLMHEHQIQNDPFEMAVKLYLEKYSWGVC